MPHDEVSRYAGRSPAHPELSGTAQGFPRLSPPPPCDNIAGTQGANISTPNPPADQTETLERVQFLRGRMTRSRRDRIVAGVGAGTAARLGVGPAFVRAAFVTLALAGGIGVVLYAVGWLGAPDENEFGEMIVADRPASNRQKVGLAAIYVALLLLLQGMGLWFGSVVWPTAFVSFGLALVWDRTGTDYASHIAGTGEVRSQRAIRRTRFQFLVGGALLVGGAIVLLGSMRNFARLGTIAVAIILTAAGFMLVFGPRVSRLLEDLASERRARIRSEERAEMAAHLHDSVLQTFALIQRTDDPKRMVTLARAQERELRSWLYSQTGTLGDDAIESAISAAATRVETAHDVPIDVVVVGDRPIDERTAGLVAAASEAMANAAEHSGAPRVSVYVECDGDGVEAWISDLGKGFDPDAVPQDRRGISESIIGRMRRLGGSAAIHSEVGEGTEVHLELEER